MLVSPQVSAMLAQVSPDRRLRPAPGDAPCCGCEFDCCRDGADEGHADGCSDPWASDPKVFWHAPRAY